MLLVLAAAPVLAPPAAALPPELAGYDPGGQVRFATPAAADAKREQLVTAGPRCRLRDRGRKRRTRGHGAGSPAGHGRLADRPPHRPRELQPGRSGLRPDRPGKFHPPADPPWLNPLPCETVWFDLLKDRNLAIHVYREERAEDQRREILWAAGEHLADDSTHACLGADGRVSFFVNVSVRVDRLAAERDGCPLELPRGLYRARRRASSRAAMTVSGGSNPTESRIRLRDAPCFSAQSSSS